METTKIIMLGTSLPCAVYNPNNESEICGKPATVAYCYPHTPRIPDPPMKGLWVIQPVCKECADRAAKVYEV